MITVLHLRLVDRFLKHDLRNAKLHKTNQGSNFLRGSFINRDIGRTPIQYRIITSLLLAIFQRSNETSWEFLALKLTIHFLRKSTQKSNSKPETKKSHCQKLDYQSHLEEKNIITEIAIIHKTSTRPLMRNRKRVGPRMKPSESSPLKGHSCKDFQSITTKSCLLPRTEDAKTPFKNLGKIYVCKNKYYDKSCQTLFKIPSAWELQ